MAGIYIHIPFCKSRCIYCDFFSTTRLEERNSYVDTLGMEIKLRNDYLNNSSISTIYIGGGTPSQLAIRHLQTLFEQLAAHFRVNPDAEITMEANPDDLTDEYVASIRQHLPVNRVSIGIQTFSDQRLQFLRRRHNAKTAIEAVNTLKRHGFSNISIDLIYGFPNEDIQQWNDDIDHALALDVPHISAYSLSYEDGTPLTALKEKGVIKENDDETCEMMYHTLISKLKDAGFRHYEISNFCKPGMHSRHNSSYWDSTPYLGIGAGAHSYNRIARQWNENSISEYISRINKAYKAYNDGNQAESQRLCVFEQETLDTGTRYNDLVMTSLRTSAGINLNKLEKDFGNDYMEHLKTSAMQHLKAGTLEYGKYTPIDCECPTDDDAIRLTEKGIFVSNGIISDLFK